MIFGGQAGGFQGDLAELIGEMRGVEFVPIEFEVADDLAYWRAEIPGKVVASAEALTGPTTPEGQRVQLLNPPDRKSTRLNSSHANISYAVFCLKKKACHSARSLGNFCLTPKHM